MFCLWLVIYLFTALQRPPPLHLPVGSCNVTPKPCSLVVGRCLVGELQHCCQHIFLISCSPAYRIHVTYFFWHVLACHFFELVAEPVRHLLIGPAFLLGVDLALAELLLDGVDAWYGGLVLDGKDRMGWGGGMRRKR